MNMNVAALVATLGLVGCGSTEQASKLNSNGFRQIIHCPGKLEVSINGSLLRTAGPKIENFEGRILDSSKIQDAQVTLASSFQSVTYFFQYHAQVKSGYNNLVSVTKTTDESAVVHDGCRVVLPTPEIRTVEGLHD